MPTNLVSLLLFVVLLAPGLISITWRSFRPIRQPTVLGELAGLVFRSLICDILAIGVFAATHVIWPQYTLDFGELIRTRTLREHLREHYMFTAWWSLGLLILACLFAYLGTRMWAGLTTRSDKAPWKWGSPIFEKLVPGNVAAYQPAWWEIFEYHKGQKRVDCVLDDGTYFSGILNSFNPDPNETDHRELSLVGDIYVRYPGDNIARRIGGRDFNGGVSATIISARSIRYLNVTYLSTNKKEHGRFRRCVAAVGAKLAGLAKHRSNGEA